MRKWLAPIFIVAAFAFSIIVYSRLPERMPMQWGWHGGVNRYGSRLEGAFLAPVLMLGLWLLMRFLPRIDPKRANYAKFADTYELLVNSFIAVLAVIHVAQLGTALGWPIAMQRLVPALVGVLFIILGNALPRARPNWWFGIRTPWTLSNDRVWTRTHRVAGYLLAGAGVVLLIAAALPSAWTFAFGVTAVGAAAFGSFVYSYFAWKQETSK
ncbi:MAG TPA: SdpI family protein [Gemmatimonadaceae bacterium]|nr:SdpI family protein [Gemmatimonadaceae bacterium]